MKPAAVTSVPVSIGNAVEVQAKEAARSRSHPCSSFTTIISVAMMASSTSRPSAMISAPSVTRCRSRPSIAIATNTIASTSGTEVATTRPERQPSEKKLTASTIASASTNERVKSNDRARRRPRLIGDARDRDALRQFGLEIGERRVERLAERQDIAALLHDDADFERGLAFGADEERRRVFVAVRDVRDVAEPEGLSVGEDRRFRDRADALLRAGHAHRHALRVGLEFAGGRQRVLLGERIEQRRSGTPSVASLAWLNSTKMRSPWSP